MSGWSGPGEYVIEEGTLTRKAVMSITIEQDVPKFMHTVDVNKTEVFTNRAGGEVKISVMGEKRYLCLCDNPIIDFKINQMLSKMLTEDEDLEYPLINLDLYL